MARGVLFPLILTILPILPVLFSPSSTLPVPAVDAVPRLDSPPRKIALLHMYNNVRFFARLGKLTADNKARYARRHGYDIVHSTPLLTSGILKKIHCQRERSEVLVGPDQNGLCWGQDMDFDIDHSRAPTFGKIKLALAACNGRDDGWLLWTDADAMVINQTIPLENLIDDAYDIMLAYDWLMVNAGMLLLKCSEWTKNFLSEVYNARKFDSARALDQSSFQAHIESLTETDRKQHIKVVPKHAMNVYIEEYRPGDFLLHMAGKLYEATEPGLFAIANQFDILSTVDEVEDIDAFFRGRHLLSYYSGTCKVEPGERQSHCKPDDPRRILLNESLGSMAYPNRYRHVGLRYYWLGDWTDNYDKPGWDVKSRSLPYVPKPNSAEMPPPPPSLLHNEKGFNPENKIDPHNGRSNENALGDELKADNNPPEVEHDVDMKKPTQKNVRDKGGMSIRGRTEKKIEDDDDGGDDDDDEDDEDDGWPIYVWVLILSLSLSTLSACAYALKRRRMKNAKMQ